MRGAVRVRTAAGATDTSLVMNIIGRAKVGALIAGHRLVRPVLPRGYHPYQVAGGKIFLDLREQPTMLLRRLGWYERDRLALLKQVLSPGMTFADVGSNKGDYALLAARLMADEGAILAFEPETVNCGWIRKSIALNGYRSIRVYEVALTETDGVATLRLGARSGQHSLVGSEAQTSAATIDVACRSLDSVVAEAGIGGIDVLKIDVEGAELGVLHGATHTLRGDRPMIVLMDIHPWLGVDAREVEARLRDFGFTLRRARPPYARIDNVRADLSEVVAVRGSESALLVLD